MADAHSLIHEYFGELKNLPAWGGTAEYGSWLSFNFGQPYLEIREANPKARSKRLQRITS